MLKYRISFIGIFCLYMNLVFGQKNDDCQKQLYKGILNFIKNSLVKDTKKIHVSDTIVYFEFASFFDKLKNRFSILELDSIDNKYRYNAYYSKCIRNLFKTCENPTHILFFSEPYKNYLIVEVLKINKLSKSFSHNQISRYSDGRRFLFKL